MKLNKVIFFVCLCTSIVLIVAGFFVPPLGVIDGSVLTAVGELFAFATLATIPYIAQGRSVELKHGNTTLALGDDDEAEKTE